VLVGGELIDIGGNAKLGQGEYLVAEPMNPTVFS
jgi:UDP-N-acetylmuramate-alanine ligase